jgi:hypothetical protein
MRVTNRTFRRSPRKPHQVSSAVSRGSVAEGYRRLFEEGYKTNVDRLWMHLRPIQYKSISGSSSAELATSVSSSTSSTPSSASERSILLPDNDEDGEEELSAEAGSNFVIFT